MMGTETGPYGRRWSEYSAMTEPSHVAEGHAPGQWRWVLAAWVVRGAVRGRGGVGHSGRSPSVGQGGMALPDGRVRCDDGSAPI
jgi:hypothetical protein